MILDEIFNEFIATKKLSLKKQTVRTYISAYNKHISENLGLRTLDTINYIEYQKYADNLLLNGLAPKTVKNILKLLSSITSFAIRCEWYSGKDYVSMVELPHFDNKYYVTISADIQKKYLLALKHAKEDIYKDMFLFLLHGRRIGEVINLDWKYLDLNAGIVYYPATKNKSKKHLTYELTEELIRVLRIQRTRAVNRQNSAFPTGKVFINPNTNEKFSNITKPWKRLLKENKLPHIPLHKIRHILTTYLLNELKLPLETVSFVLGHSSVEITKRYVTFKPQIARNAIDVLFEDMKTKGEKVVEEINRTYRMGEHIETLLFSDKKSNEVGR